MNYKDTLNLPQTSFAMKANLPQKEPDILKTWQEKNIYHKLREIRKNRATFILHDGPPYANGPIHIGHAVNKILKDITIKSKNLDGLNAPYVPGWDCHGLPIELNIEKKHGKVGNKTSPNEFRALCRNYAHKQIELQKKDFVRLGVLGDWDNPYLTMRQETEANIIRSLAHIYKNGHLVQGYKPVHWCFDCASSLAEAEIEYQNKQSTTLDAGFLVNRSKESEFLFAHCKEKAKIFAVIWTTTPWTLPANQAVCIDPNINYSLVACDDCYLLLAEALVQSCAARYKRNLITIKSFIGKELLSVELEHLFDKRLVPILAGSHVETKLGTGIVHTAPDHGVDDYSVCKKNNIDTLSLLNANGVYKPEVPQVGGMHIWQAEETIIKYINALGNFIYQEEITHSYPHCWRHKTPVIFRATPQFFISMQNIAQQAYEAAEAVKFFPPSGKARFQSMLDNRPDWCISRQRYWGVPLVLFVHKETEQLHPRTEYLMKTIADMVSKEGIDAWFNLNAQELLGDEANEYNKINHTLDVWYDSGSSHFSVLRTRDELQYPADLYIEGSDQHRGWFQSSLLVAIAIDNSSPYKQIITHGFVVDEKGNKMSKSAGNVIAPQEIIRDNGADILRLWVATSDYHTEISIGKTIVQSNIDLYRRVRNTARFLLANIADFNPKDVLPPQDLIAIDAWVLEQARLLQDKIKKHYAEYKFISIVQEIYNFCCQELGAVFLDVVKDRQYTCSKTSHARRSAQSAMYHLVHALARWLMPITSFTAEEIYHHIPGVEQDDSVLLQEWYPLEKNNLKIPQEHWNTLLALRESVNKTAEEKRNAKEITSLLSCNLTVYVDEPTLAILSIYQEELHFFFIVSQITCLPIENSPSKNTGVKLVSSDSPKCNRCWHHTAEVGNHQEYPELCDRCVSNIKTDGETRRLF